MAVAGDTTESMGAAIRGIEKLKASMLHDTETSCGSRVRRLGTMATSSNVYPRRARFERPISISLMVVFSPSTDYLR
jgi:hypothetical protein